MVSLKKSPQLRTKFLHVYIIIVVTMVILSVALVGASLVNKQIASPKPTVIYYTLAWQNQPGPFGYVTDSDTYQYINFELAIISDSDFEASSNITMLADGEISQSLVNDSLAGIQLVYDGAIPYPSEQGFIGTASLTLNVNKTVTTGSFAVGDIYGVFARPTSFGWLFS